MQGHDCLQRKRRSWPGQGMALACLCGAIFASTNVAEAQRRPRIRPSTRDIARQYNREQTQAQIQMIERQMREAQQVLTQLQTQKEMTESELSSLTDRLSEGQSSAEGQSQELTDITKKIRELETRILESQQSGSPLAQSEGQLDQAEDALKAAQVAALSEASPTLQKQGPLDAGILTTGQRNYLKSHEGYQAALKVREQALLERNRIRQKLLQDHPEWKRAQQDRAAAAKAASEASKEQRLASRKSSRARSQAQTLKLLGQKAEYILATGAMQLKQLGVSDQQIQQILQGGTTP